jgi:hypothetical protein
MTPPPTLRRRRRAALGVPLSLSAAITLAAPTPASAAEHDVVGDGVLSREEAEALNAMDPELVTAADLVDLRPHDLPALDAELRARVQTAVAEHREVVDAPDDLGEWASERTFKVYTTNIYGWELTRLYLGVHWSWNGKVITETPHFNEWATTSWGWARCSTQSSGGWSSSAHFRYRLNAIGYFSLVGCPADLQILTIDAFVYGDGGSRWA